MPDREANESVAAEKSSKSQSVADKSMEAKAPVMGTLEAANDQAAASGPHGTMVFDTDEPSGGTHVADTGDQPVGDGPDYEVLDTISSTLQGQIDGSTDDTIELSGDQSVGDAEEPDNSQAGVDAGSSQDRPVEGSDTPTLVGGGSESDSDSGLGSGSGFGSGSGSGLGSGSGSGFGSGSGSKSRGGTYNIEQLGTFIRTRHVKELDAPPSLDDDYELLEKLGEGGMGVVFRARQCSMNREVAIKRIKSGGGDSRSRDKFLVEAAVTGELAHPNIVPIHDLGTNPDGDLFYSMKVVSGESWKDVIRYRYKPLDENVDILLRLCDAVAFAHSRGIVHQDLKPENTMLGDFGEVLAMDWGLAGHVDSDLPLPSGGSPSYMAPEMAQEFLREMGARDWADGPEHKRGAHSDIYLLGAILFEIVTQHPPHGCSRKGKDRKTQIVECLRNAANNIILPLGDEDDELLAVARKAMSTDPVDRYHSVAEFQDALRAYQRHAQSIKLAVRADSDLEEGKQTREYDTLARAQFGFEDALELWSDNKRAVVGLHDAKLAFAEAAYQNEDYDLGISLLDPADPDDQKWHGKMVAGRTARIQRRTRLRAALAGIIVLLLGIAGLVQYSKGREVKLKNEAIAAKKVAEELAESEAAAKVVAVTAQKKAEDLAESEAAAKEDAVAARNTAEKLARSEAAAKDDAIAAQLAEKRARLEAIEQAELARRGEFASRVALADSQLKTNNEASALGLLELLRTRQLEHEEKAGAAALARLHDWEWHYLYRLTHPELSNQEVEAGPMPRLAVQRDGARFATAMRTAEGADVSFWEPGTETQRTVTIPLGDRDRISDICFTRDGRYVIAGFERRSEAPNLFVVDVESTETVDSKSIHHQYGNGAFVGGRVLSVAASPTQDIVATAGYSSAQEDRHGARLWRVDATGKLVRIENYLPNRLSDGHNALPVYSIAFSDDGTTVAEVAQAGRTSKTSLIMRSITFEGVSTESAKTESPRATSRIVFAPQDPSRVAYASDTQVNLFKRAGQRLSGSSFPTDHQGTITDVGFSVESGLVYTAGERQIMSWTEDGTRFDSRLPSHRETVVALRMVENAAGREMVFTADELGRVRWLLPDELSSTTPLDTGKGSVQFTAASRNAEYFFAAVNEQSSRNSLAGVTPGRLFAADGNELGSVGVEFVTGPNMRVVYWAGAKRYVTIGSHGAVWGWDINAANGVAVNGVASGGENPVRLLLPALSPSERSSKVPPSDLVTVSTDGRFLVRYAKGHFEYVAPESFEVTRVPMSAANVRTIAVAGDKTGYAVFGAQEVDPQIKATSGGNFGKTTPGTKHHFLGASVSGALVRVTSNNVGAKVDVFRDRKPTSYELPASDIVDVSLAGERLLIEFGTADEVRLLVLFDIEAGATEQVGTDGAPLPPGVRDACLDAEGAGMLLLTATSEVWRVDAAGKRATRLAVSDSVMSTDAQKIAAGDPSQCVTWSSSGKVRVWDLTVDGKLMARCASSVIDDAMFLGRHPETGVEGLLTLADSSLFVWNVKSIDSGYARCAGMWFREPGQEILGVRRGTSPWEVFALVANGSEMVVLRHNLATNESKVLGSLTTGTEDFLAFDYVDGMGAVLTQSRLLVFAPGEEFHVDEIELDAKPRPMVCVSPDQRGIAVVVDGPAGRQTCLLHQFERGQFKNVHRVVSGRPITAITFSQSGKRILLGYRDGKIWVRDVGRPANSQDLVSVVAHNQPVESLEFSGNGRTLITSDSRNVYVHLTSGWDLWPNGQDGVTTE